MELLLNYLKSYKTIPKPISLINTSHKYVNAINELNFMVAEKQIDPEIVDYQKIQETINIILEMKYIKENDDEVLDVLFYPEDRTEHSYNFTIVYPKRRK